MKLHLPKLLAAAVLACMCSSIASAAELTTAQTTYTKNNVSTDYSGYIFTWDATGKAANSSTELHKVAMSYTFNGTDGTQQAGTCGGGGNNNATIGGKNLYALFCNTQDSGDYGVAHTLRLTGATNTLVHLDASFKPFNLGGLITEGTGSYSLGRGQNVNNGSTGTDTKFVFQGNNNVNMDIAADTYLEAGHGYEVATGGVWVVAQDKTLTFLHSTENDTCGLKINDNVAVEIKGGGSVVSGDTLTIGSGSTITLGENTSLSATGLINSGKIVFSTGSKLDVGMIFEIGQTYDLGVLENVTKSNLVGLGARADISYNEVAHTFTVSGTIGNLVWNGGAGNLTDSKWTWDGAAATFEEGDDATISGSGSSVTIEDSHIIHSLTLSDSASATISGSQQIGTLSVDGAALTLGADSQVSGISSLTVSGSGASFTKNGTATLAFAETAEFTLDGTNMSLVNLGGSTKHFTKKGDGTLTLTGNGMIGADGTVTVECGTLAVTGHDSGTAALSQADVTVKAGATLSLDHDTLGWDGNRTKSITLIGEEGSVAKLTHASTSNTTLQVALNMQGYATVDGTGSFNTYRQSGDRTSGIFVTNDHNTFAAELGIRGPLTINVEGGGSLDFTGKLAKNTQGGGDTTRSVTKTGTGDLNLSNSGNNYDEAFVVSGGTLRLVDGAAATSGTLTISSGATLAYKGDGTLGSNVTIDEGGKLAVESGTLTLNQALAITATDGVLLGTAASGDTAATTGTIKLGTGSLAYGGATYTAVAGADASTIAATGAKSPAVTDATQTFTGVNIALTADTDVKAAMVNSSISNTGNVVIYKTSAEGGQKLVDVTAADFRSGHTNDAAITTISGAISTTGYFQVGGGTTTITGDKSTTIGTTLGLWDTATLIIDGGRNMGSVSLAKMNGAKLTIADGSLTVTSNVTVTRGDTTNGNIRIGAKGSLGLASNASIDYDGVVFAGTGTTSAVTTTSEKELSLWSDTMTFTDMKVTTSDTRNIKANLDNTQLVVTGGSANLQSAQSNIASVDLQGGAVDAQQDTTITGGVTLADDTTLKATNGATLTLNGEVALGNGTGKVQAEGGTVKLAGGSITGDNVTISAKAPAQPETKAAGLVRSGANEAVASATLANVTVSNSEISGSGAGGSLAGATVSVSATGYGISDLDLTGSDITVEDGASLTLENVVMQDSNVATVGTGSVTLSGATNELTLTATSVADVEVVDGAHVLTLDLKAADLSALVQFC